MKKILLAAIAALTFGAVAQAGGDIIPVQEVVVVPAEKDFYVGFSGQTVLSDRASRTDFLDDAAYGVGVQAGYTFLRSGAFSTAVEARYTYSWADKSLGDTGVLSAFLKPGYDFGPVAVYGLVGYANVDVDAFGSNSDWAYGAGLSTELSSSWEVFVDYTVNPDYDKADLTSFDISKFDNEVVTVGLNYKF